jgi:hypothetical protein
LTSHHTLSPENQLRSRERVRQPVEKLVAQLIICTVSAAAFWHTLLSLSVHQNKWFNKGEEHGSTTF